MLSAGSAPTAFFSARHPRTGEGVMLGKDADGALFEVHAASPPHASWLLADEVVGDGRLLLGARR